MDDFSTPESSPTASTETVASPAPAPSASAQPEATQSRVSTPAQPVSPEPIGDSSTPSPEIEFPDDAAFQALPSEQRRSNWQQLRDQYAETKRRVGELSRYEAHKPTIETIEQLGGLERLQQQAELATGLFSPVIDPETNEPVIGQDGLPQYTAEPFLERLVSQSPSTFGEVMWRGFDMPSPYDSNETIGHLFMRERLGLDPALLDTYQQIKSPQDAARFISTNGGITSEELANIPQEYHDAYKSLTAELREEVGLMGDVAREQYLAERQELLENRKFREEQKAFQEQQRQQQYAAFQQRVQQAGEQKVESVRNASINAQRERLQTEAPLHSDPEVNSRIHNEILTNAADEVMSDPLLAKDAANCERLYRLAVKYELEGDRFKAFEAQNQADRLATKLTGRLTNAVTKHTGFWSRALGVSRATTQQQIQNAQPRVEIQTGGGTPNTRQPDKRVLTAPNGEGFGFTPERLAQFKAQLDQARLAQ